MLSFVRSLRLGLLHVALAITLVPITSVLNRVMIHEFGILASVVAALVILPYLLSPVQVWIGQYSDTHPMFGYRRTPYIAAGLLLAIGGAILTPHAALLMSRDLLPGLLLGVVAFGAWGMGFNLATVGYLSLANDLSSESQRSRTIAIMWFMMIISVIVAGITIGRALSVYSEPLLIRVFRLVGLIALILSALGLIGLEPRHTELSAQPRHSRRAALRLIARNRQARLFFVYLIMLLAAILGQDILLEPFGAAAFGMSVRDTTQLTATWGGMVLIALLAQGFVLSRVWSKKTGALVGGGIAAAGLLLIGLSGMIEMQALFVPGVATLGFGTGLSTATNLALMLDMTTPEQVGLFIGAWGVADALARGAGTLIGGVVRDLITAATGSASGGYVTVFLIEALLLGISLVLLRRIDVGAFRREQPSLSEIVALGVESGG